ncbi:YARHG domain-containing protein [candidate division WOR-3 bacterium]|nr:YARHG domain-containing protein [candidate division WOR-3 bacterium]
MKKEFIAKLWVCFGALNIIGLLFAIPLNSRSEGAGLYLGTIATAPIPLGNSHIRMVKLKMRVECGWKESWVECWYTLRNESNDSIISTIIYPSVEKLVRLDPKGNDTIISVIHPTFQKVILYRNRQTSVQTSRYRDVGRLRIGSDSIMDAKHITKDIDYHDYYANFVKWSENLPVKYRKSYEKYKSPKEYFIWNIPFEKGETKVFGHDYNYYNIREETGKSPQALWSAFVFFLKAASAWKGSIDTVDIKVYGLSTFYPNWRVKDQLKTFRFFGESTSCSYLGGEAYFWAKNKSGYLDSLHDFSPEGYSIHADTVSWLFTNIEPDFNIEIILNSWQNNGNIHMLIRDFLNKDRFGKAKFKTIGTVDIHEAIELQYGRHNLFHFTDPFFFVVNHEKERWIHPYSLYHLSTEELQYLINGIYAARRFPFKNEDIAEQFSQFEWYDPTNRFNERWLKDNDWFNIFEIKRAMEIMKKYEGMK